MEKMSLSRQHTALLNIDMQHFFVNQVPESKELLKRINRLASSCRKADMRVIHTRHIFEPKVAAGTEAIALHKDLIVDARDIVFEKHHFNAFHESDLTELLLTHHVNTLIITGVRTNNCCQATAWGAVSRGFNFYFLSDGTATKEMGGVSSSLLQTATCATFNHLFDNVVTVGQTLVSIEKAINGGKG